jgi:hypothetical protein
VASSMDELERSVVQLWEAKRLAEFNDVAHGRLALLLLDNAAEMSLRRSVQRRLQFADMYGVLLSQLNDVDPNDTKAAALRSEFEPKVVSRRRRGKIDRNFAELVDFVAEDKKGACPRSSRGASRSFTATGTLLTTGMRCALTYWDRRFRSCSTCAASC